MLHSLSLYLDAFFSSLAYTMTAFEEFQLEIFSVIEIVAIF